MRISKFLPLSVFITSIALLYVWQQTEIFRLAYDGQKKVAIFQELLDENALLRYNKAKNASLVRIGSKISKVADFQMPDAYRLVRLSEPSETLRLVRRIPKKENLFSKIFSIKRQAEAKTIDR